MSAGLSYAQIDRRLATDRARRLVREAAMCLAERGLSADTIRDAMTDMCTSETEHAVEYAVRYDAEEGG